MVRSSVESRLLLFQSDPPFSSSIEFWFWCLIEHATWHFFARITHSSRFTVHWSVHRFSCLPNSLNLFFIWCDPNAVLSLTYFHFWLARAVVQIPAGFRSVFIDLRKIFQLFLLDAPLFESRINIYLVSYLFRVLCKSEVTPYLSITWISSLWLNPIFLWWCKQGASNGLCVMLSSFILQLIRWLKFVREDRLCCCSIVDCWCFGWCAWFLMHYFAAMFPDSFCMVIVTIRWHFVCVLCRLLSWWPNFVWFICRCLLRRS